MNKAGPLFLERARYRRRRLMDAIRLLPFLGLGLWMVPLMWPLPDNARDVAPLSMADALVYVFGIWVCLVLIAMALWSWSRDRRAIEAEAASKDRLR
ncbi:MAG: hypothetical protein AAF744_13920 [Pseudomonadota bacterium]